jgi:hypothetical protein
MIYVIQAIISIADLIRNSRHEQYVFNLTEVSFKKRLIFSLTKKNVSSIVATYSTPIIIP